MRLGSASGFQLAFLTLALLAFSLPSNKYVIQAARLDGEWAELFGRTLPFILYFAIVAAVPRFRARALTDLSAPIPEDKRVEVAVVSVWKVLFAFAFAGGLALLVWFSHGGGPGLESSVRLDRIHEENAAKAFSIAGIVGTLLVAAFVGPIAEELFFRGVLYRAWDRQLGWVAAMILTSTVFALYHTHFIPAFLGSIVYVCIYRRTGTLRSAIYVHAIFNLALWYPLLGQFMFPSPERAWGDLTVWSLQIAAVLTVLLTLPIYVFMARNRHQHQSGDS